MRSNKGDTMHPRIDPNGAHFLLQLNVFRDLLATIHQKAATYFLESLIFASDSFLVAKSLPEKATLRRDTRAESGWGRAGGRGVPERGFPQCHQYQRKI